MLSQQERETRFAAISSVVVFVRNVGAIVDIVVVYLKEVFLRFLWHQVVVA